MLIRHPTSGLFWSVNDAREISLAKEGSVYVKSTCDVPPHVATWDQNTSHLKNTVTGKCICRLGDKLVEAEHGGIANGLFEWTIVDGMVQSYLDKYVDGDLSLVDQTSVQWHMADSFDEDVTPTEAEPELVTVTPTEVEPELVTVTPTEVEPELVTVTPTEVEPEEEEMIDDEEDVPVARASALIEEALNAQAEVSDEENVPALVSDSEEPEATPEIEQVIAETVADVLAPIEEAQATPEEAQATPAPVKKPSASE